MEIPEKLLKYKFQILIALIFCITLVSVVFIAPSLITVLAYFWPLFLSTALFLFLVVVFGRTSVTGTEVHGENKAGVGILDYVAGHLEHHPVESFKSED
ncbi:hypothetical protein I3843_11G197500 [Carya illinoinensis]|uniref:Transmembrane protein n=1 Tax=Carya illinoinensis TaxID=32201 RepID=A0A922J2I2_CARIL|nr:hypothetical protein I3760_11G196900 [Carya illinoinensis]KAG6689964.1 hypothetical protein I3842_11G199600 [Carya illinoinensis]KAG7957882.1 hypothetical protein I3843_11G197500 [Carya illinoinensis]